MRSGDVDAPVGRRVLIVDDEPDLVETCRRLLATREYVCLKAHTAKEAIALIDEALPDLVITDLHLPDLEGGTVLAHARSRTPPIPIILMTAYHSGRAVRAAYDAGAVRYLAKPFSASQFIDAVDTLLK